jgi:RNA polymerase sigma factor (sigma-70 family)
MAGKSNHILWSKFKEGDIDALTMLYKEYTNELYSYGLKIINDEDLVKDCIQEVFIQLIDKRESLQITSRVHLYLFKSLRNKLFEESRSKHKRQDILRLQLVVDEPYEPSTEQQLINSEEKKNNQVEIANAIHKLTERQQEVIFLKFTEGFDYDEIAELLNIDIASVRTLVYRSLKNIKKLLGPKAFLLLNLFRPIFI